MGNVKRKVGTDAKSAAKEQPAGSGHRGRVARRLRDERRKQGLRLAVVADALRIRKTYICAIENERFAELPGPAYALGFVGSYAHFLDLDRAAIVAQFRDEIAGDNIESELKFPVPLKDGRFPGRAVMAASFALAIAVYAGWYAYTTAGAGKLAAGAGQPAGLPAKARVGGDGISKAAKTAAVSPAAAKAGVEAVPRHNRTAARIKQGAAVPGRPKPEKKARDAARGNRAAVLRAKAHKAKAEKRAAAAVPASGKARIVLKALQDTWVQIQMADGRIVLSRLLKSGESYPVLKNRGFVLTAGNAGGLRIIVDGRALQALGPKGAVRRGIRLDADALLASR